MPDVLSKCPKCRLSLIPQEIDRTTVGFCATCKGMWLPKGTLAKSTGGGGSDFPDFVGASQAAVPTNLTCPICPATPALTRFRYASGCDVEIEYCPICGGIFLDFHEFPKVQAVLRGRKPSPGPRSESSDRTVWDHAWRNYRKEFRSDRRWLFTQELWTTLPFRVIRQFSPLIRPPSYQSFVMNFLVYGLSSLFVLSATGLFLALFAGSRGFTIHTTPASIYPLSFLTGGISGALGIIVLDFFREPPPWDYYLESAEKELKGRKP